MQGGRAVADGHGMRRPAVIGDGALEGGDLRTLCDPTTANRRDGSLLFFGTKQRLRNGYHVTSSPRGCQLNGFVSANRSAALRDWIVRGPEADEFLRGR